MSVDTTVDRLVERGHAILAWERLGGSIDRLARLDYAVRHARTTDWPGRPWADERRQGIPALDLAEHERREIGR